MRRILGFLLIAVASPVAAGSAPKVSDAEAAIRAACDWLVRHQNPDGSWSSHDISACCDEKKGPCKLHPESPDYLEAEGRGWENQIWSVRAEDDWQRNLGTAVSCSAEYDGTAGGIHSGYNRVQHLRE